MINEASKMLEPLAWLSADLSSAITARSAANIPELGGDPSPLYPIPLYRISPDHIQRINAMEAEQEQWREAVRCVVGAELPKYLRMLVAGWNGEDRQAAERFGRHPVKLGATIPTTCGAVYELDETLRCLAALTGIEVASTPRIEV